MTYRPNGAYAFAVRGSAPIIKIWFLFLSFLIVKRNVFFAMRWRDFCAWCCCCLLWKYRTGERSRERGWNPQFCSHTHPIPHNLINNKPILFFFLTLVAFFSSRTSKPKRQKQKFLQEEKEEIKIEFRLRCDCDYVDPVVLHVPRHWVIWVPNVP